MQQITLQPVPSQQVQLVLGGQNCQIAVYMLGTRMYVDLTVAGVAVSQGVLAHNLTSLVPTAYLGFVGTLAFLDTMGSEAPQYAGLGGRWQMLYLTSSDFAALGAS